MPALRGRGVLPVQEILLLLLLLPRLGPLRVERLHLEPFLGGEARQVPDEADQLPACKLALLALVAPSGHAGEAHAVLDDGEKLPVGKPPRPREPPVRRARAQPLAPP